MTTIYTFLESKKDFGVLILRLLFGFRLVEGMCIVIFTGQIHGVADFFGRNQIPVPLISAYLTVSAELICGILPGLCRSVHGRWLMPDTTLHHDIRPLV
jgi:hypothetical protein